MRVAEKRTSGEKGEVLSVLVIFGALTWLIEFFFGSESSLSRKCSFPRNVFECDGIASPLRVIWSKIIFIEAKKHISKIWFALKNCTRAFHVTFSLVFENFVLQVGTKYARTSLDYRGKGSHLSGKRWEKNRGTFPRVSCRETFLLRTYHAFITWWWFRSLEIESESLATVLLLL